MIPATPGLDRSFGFLPKSIGGEDWDCDPALSRVSNEFDEISISRRLGTTIPTVFDLNADQRATPITICLMTLDLSRESTKPSRRQLKERWGSRPRRDLWTIPEPSRKSTSVERSANDRAESENHFETHRLSFGEEFRSVQITLKIKVTSDRFMEKPRT